MHKQHLVPSLDRAIDEPKGAYLPAPARRENGPRVEPQDPAHCGPMGCERAARSWSKRTRAGYAPTVTDFPMARPYHLVDWTAWSHADVVRTVYRERGWGYWSW